MFADPKIPKLSEYAETAARHLPDTMTLTGVEEKDGLLYYVYTTPIEDIGTDFRYYNFVFKGEDSFRTFSFAVSDGNADSKERFILDAARTISLSS